MVDGDRPADPKDHEGDAIEPMEVTKQFLVAGVYSVFIFLHFLFIFAFTHFLLSHVFQQGSFVDFMEENVTPDEGERNCDGQGY